MAVGMQRQQFVAPRDAEMDGGSASTRSFWTQRRKTATSLMAIMGMLAGVAVAYKLFQQTVPNNVVRDASSFDYVILARDDDAGETTFHGVSGANDQVVFRQSKVSTSCPGQAPPNPTSEFCNVDMYPGDTRMSEVLITNTNLLPSKDASFDVYVDPGSIVVYQYDLDRNHNGTFDPGDIDIDGDSVLDEYHVVTANTAPWTRFVNFWTLRVDKQTYFTVPGGSDQYENDPTDDGAYATGCAAAAIRSVTAASPCKLGMIKGNGSAAAAVPGNPEPGNTIGVFPSRPDDDRLYRFYMAEEDDLTDQSPFLGWRIQFSLVFRARLSPEPETARTSQLPVRDDGDADPVCTGCP